EEMKKGEFREDLYYRLNVIPINIPPLRERTDDVLSLVQYYVSFFNEKYHVTKSISHRALEKLQQYHWPGNVRELKNIIERVIVLTDKDKIEVEDLETSIIVPRSEVEKRNEAENEGDVVVQEIMPLKDCIDQAEKQLLALAKEKYDSTTEIANALQVNQSTISRKMKKYGIG